NVGRKGYTEPRRGGRSARLRRVRTVYAAFDRKATAEIAEIAEDESRVSACSARSAVAFISRVVCRRTSDGSRSTRRRGRFSAGRADDVERFVAAGQRIRNPNLDERLARDAESPRFRIDCAQQIHRKVDIHTLDFTTRPPRRVPVDIAIDLVGSRIE